MTSANAISSSFARASIDWGLDEVMSTSRGLTALFQGGPGTGKTLVAGAIARDLGLSTDRYANQEVNFVLQRLDTFEGIAILTTYAGSAIDPAFRRRMSFRLTFPFPDDEAREALWKVHLPKSAPRLGALDLADLARRFRMSGSLIRNAALRACFLAADEGAGITQGHLERAIRSEFHEIGKLGETGVLE